MKPTLIFSVVSAAVLALAATGFFIKSDPARAQQATEEMEEIVVQAPVERRYVGVASTTGAKIELIELRRRVYFADLDLSNDTDVAELKTRIKTTAKESCKQLSDMFPLDASDRHEIQRCTKKAVGGTDKQVQAAIAAAS
ncbi:MAG: UrcA family protein [Gammaproteobacteria bacterium]|nr:UrcA family protein [Gammaproteobacteria bacterium]